MISKYEHDQQRVKNLVQIAGESIIYWLLVPPF